MSATDMQPQREKPPEVARPWRLRWRKRDGNWREYDRYASSDVAWKAAWRLEIDLAGEGYFEIEVTKDEGRI